MDWSCRDGGLITNESVPGEVVCGFKFWHKDSSRVIVVSHDNQALAWIEQPGFTRKATRCSDILALRNVIATLFEGTRGDLGPLVRRPTLHVEASTMDEAHAFFGLYYPLERVDFLGRRDSAAIGTVPQVCRSCRTS